MQKRTVLHYYFAAYLVLEGSSVQEKAVVEGFGARDFGVRDFGSRDFGDECEFIDLSDPTTFVSRLEEWKYCDAKRGLECVTGLGVCGCTVPHTIYRGGKCRAKVNNGCLIKDFKLECVEFASCTRNSSDFTFRCKCDRGYLSNAERTACFARSTYPYGRSCRYGDAYGCYYGRAASSLYSSTHSKTLFLGFLLVYFCGEINLKLF